MPDAVSDPCLCLDRALVYRCLARVFAEPRPGGFEELRSALLPELRAALARLTAGAGLEALAAELDSHLQASGCEASERSYFRTFDASSGPRCAPTETSHTSDSAAHALTRNHEMADIAGFYRAFGVEVCEASERPDHIAAELEFMQLLAIKEALAQDEGGPGCENACICADAARSFLGDHLTRWLPRLAERLEGLEGENAFYVAAGRLARDFAAFDFAGREPHRAG